MRLCEMQDRMFDVSFDAMFIKQYIENGTIYKYRRLQTSKAEHKLCTKIICDVSNLYISNRSIDSAAKKLNVSPFLLRDFLLEADRLKAIDYTYLKAKSKKPSVRFPPYFVKEYIENETIYEFLKLDASIPKDRICKEIIKHVANLYVCNRTLENTGKKLNVKLSLLREFLLQADKLHAIDFGYLKTKSKNRNLGYTPSFIRKYIEDESIRRFIELNENVLEDKMCKEIVEHVVNLYKCTPTLESAARKLKIDGAMLNEFLLEGDRLKVIDYKLLESAKEDEVRKAVRQIVEHFRKYHSIKRVAESMNMSHTTVRSLLFDEYKCSSIVELRNKIGLKKSLSRKQIERIRRVKECYDRCMSLQEAADEFHISRERVRQILQQGDRHGLFTYETHENDRLEEKLEEARRVKAVYDRCLTLRRTVNELRVTQERVRYLLQLGDRHGLFRHDETKRLKELRQQYDRKALIKEIKRHITRSQVCLELSVTEREFDKLLEYYSIDYQEYLRVAKKGKCLEQYSYIVDTLGHHPKTTEMGSRKDWRLVWVNIDKLWGNMDNFRKEFGIEKLKHQGSRHTKREERKEKIAIFVREKGPVGSKSICDEFGISPQVAWRNTVELLREGTVVKFGKGNQVKYVVNRP